MIGDAHPADTAAAHHATRDGMRAILPTALAVAPFGLVLGTTIAAAHIEPTAGLAASILILAGSSQLSTFHLISQGAAPIITIVAALLINLRFLAYSAGAAAWFPNSSRKQRAAIAYPLVDQLYLAMATDSRWDQRAESERRHFYAGAAGLLIAIWVLSQVTGYVAGGVLPDSLSLETAAPLSLAGLLAKATATRRTATAAVVAAVVAAAATPLLGPACTIVAITIAVVTTSTGGEP